MDVRALVSASLTSTLSGCCLWLCPGEQDFEEEGLVLTGAELNEILDEAQGNGIAACSAACDRAVGGEVMRVDTCELHIDPDFVRVTSLPSGDTTATTGDTVGTGDTAPGVVDTAALLPGGVVDCSGAVANQCEGRRPLRHRSASPAVGSTAALLRSCAALELASVTAFLELEGQLARLSAPSSLRRRCRDAVRDERRHARLLLALAGGGPPENPSDPLEVDAAAIDIAVHNATEGCVSECWSAVLAHHRSAHAMSPAWRRVYRRIARDETRHGQLAWDLDAWLARDILTAAECRDVAGRRRDALSTLERHAEIPVRGMPSAFGFPTPDEARRAAARFARHVHRHAGSHLVA